MSAPGQALSDRASEQPTLPETARAAALHLLLCGSGALALVYELLWMRRFAAVFGATTPAVAATLAGVFLGFTIGSWVVGGRASRLRRPWRGYGLLELGVGLSALGVEPLLSAYNRFYPALYHALAGSAAGFAAVKTVLVVAALFLPTFCMGGTVPLLGHALSVERRRLGISAGGLYAANTFGAALGAFSVPFLWLPALGARGSYGACVAGSVFIGLLAWWLDPGEQPLLTADASLPAKRGPATTAAGNPPLSSPALGILAAGSGACLFVLQVVWSRMFAQVHENSIYSFSMVVAVLLAGLSGGAALARRLLQSGRAPVRVLGWCWIGAGALILLTPPVFLFLTDGLSYLKGQGGWTSYALRILWLTVPTVLGPTLCAGMALPLLLELGGRDRAQPPGRILGKLIAINTAGAIAGCLLAAFLLPRWLGLWGSLALVGALMILGGDWCLGQGGRRGRLLARRLFLSALLAVVFVFCSRLPRTKVRTDQGEELLALRESSHGIVAVVERRGNRRIKLNNYYVLGGSASTGDERLQAHLPMLLHPAPRQVAFLGLGTGITAGAALAHPVERVTALELVPDVVAAARDYFGEANLGLVRSPRAEVLAEDARNFLSGSLRRFDVIVGDLVVPWRQGEAALYTADHFAAARRALAPGGIFCQWLPMFQLSEEEFNIVTATFLDLFPNTTLWRGDFAPGEPALALIGQPDGARLDPLMVSRRLRELKPDETNPALAHPAGVWIFLVGPLDATAGRFARARRNREDEPWLELLGPLRHAGASGTAQPPFVGRRLEVFLDELRSRPLVGSSCAELDSTQLQWRDAGADLGQATLLLAEGQARAAEVLLQKVRQALPAELHAALIGPSLPAPAGR